MIDMKNFAESRRGFKPLLGAVIGAALMLVLGKYPHFDEVHEFEA
jgi:hypothetical protein